MLLTTVLELKLYLLAGEKHGIYCGCPQKTVLVKTGEVSKLKQKLSFPRQSYIDNLRDAAFIPNTFTREKASRLLGVMNLDININTIAKLEKFTVEDILLVAQLVQSQKYDYLAKTYENIQKCVNGSSNDPRLNIRKFFGTANSTVIGEYKEYFANQMLLGTQIF